MSAEADTEEAVCTPSEFARSTIESDTSSDQSLTAVTVIPDLLTLDHENAGTVTSIGEGVRAVKEEATSRVAQ